MKLFFSWLLLVTFFSVSNAQEEFSYATFHENVDAETKALIKNKDFSIFTPSFASNVQISKTNRTTLSISGTNGKKILFQNVDTGYPWSIAFPGDDKMNTMCIYFLGEKFKYVKPTFTESVNAYGSSENIFELKDSGPEEITKNLVNRKVLKNFKCEIIK